MSAPAAYGSGHLSSPAVSAISTNLLIASDLFGRSGCFRRQSSTLRINSVPMMI